MPGHEETVGYWSLLPAMMDAVAGIMLGEQLALFGPATRLWRGGPHPRSLARDDDREGGAFLYQRCPEIFFGREGTGPMRVAMVS